MKAPETNLPSRVIIEGVRPEIDGGRFPAKCCVGDAVRVSADVFADSHDALAGVVRHRRSGSESWREVPLAALGNDRWEARFPVEGPGGYEFTVHAWVDSFASWRNELAKKVAADQDVGNELREGALLVQEAAGRARGADADWLRKAALFLAEGRNAAEAKRRALDPELANVMARWPDRSRGAAYGKILSLTVERPRAGCGAWYELFPRSCAAEPGRHGTLADCAARLDHIAAMGFDVVYLPPIHPIGTSFRKGPNNTLQAKPGDPGSPWAIGAAQGGHCSIHPDLGTLDDFDNLLAAARERNLEIALDLAFQCSPDHPYVREHPDWFRHRPDGSIKYAENPPKKYQDIYPLDFTCADWRSLWEELREVVLFWISHRVRIFRVDNPHTKPFPFWEWLIGAIQDAYPDTLFLAEAFTRPKIMHYLAKCGFAQSYTYFTWRNSKRELIDYFTELTQTEAQDYLRPNLFVNTPDILPEYLQFGGRPAFATRLVLAATLGASYGIYGPAFELAENRALPGREEYQDSEKYQVRRWDWDRADSLCDFITRINAIRRDNPALTANARLRFHATDNDQLLCFSKTTADSADAIVVAVNLDPHHVQSGWVRLALPELGLEPNARFQVHDLISDARYLWQGEKNFVELDPAFCPASVFRLRRRVKTERDFDYYL